MFVELHILQNFAPSNLNRDDTGSPKDCQFGGYRRARISSQCFKRAIREQFREDGFLPPERLAVRTKRLREEAARRLVQRYNRDRPQAEDAVKNLLASIEIKLDDEGLTQYLLFLGEAEIEAVVELCHRHWDTLQGGAATADAADASAAAPKAKTGRQVKKEARAAIPPEVGNALKQALDGGRAADLALFGRMLADVPDRNRDAAAQVAHAISTNRVDTEFDFFTAVDDRQPADSSGAGMLGTVEFNSACFYRYANVDLDQLLENLGGDEDLARQTLEAFVRASVAAIPTGKQNSMAAHNPPSLVMAVARERGLWSLANAFLQPVRPTGSHDLVDGSIEALDSYWGRLTGMYGTRGIGGTWVTALDTGRLTSLGAAAQPDLESLVQGVREAARFAPATAR